MRDRPIGPGTNPGWRCRASGAEDQRDPLLRDQSPEQRDTRAAARDAAVREAHAFGDQWAAAQARKAIAPATAMVYQVGEFVPADGGRISRDRAQLLHRQARWLGLWLRDHPVPDDLVTGQPGHAEAWLREYIRAAGQSLHRQYGCTGGRNRCRCAGCELIRGMDAPQQEGAGPGQPATQAITDRASEPATSPCMKRSPAPPARWPVSDG